MFPTRYFPNRYFPESYFPEIGSGGSPPAEYPDEDDVRAGVEYAGGTMTGTMVLPDEADVASGIQYGADGTEFEGTLTGGGGVVDANVVSMDPSVLAQFIGSNITITYPLGPGGLLKLTRGMDYQFSDNGRSIDVIDSKNVWPDLTGATPWLAIQGVGQSQQTLMFMGAVVSPTYPAKVRFNLTAAQTRNLKANQAYVWGAGATLAGGSKVDLVRMVQPLEVTDLPIPAP